MPYRKTPLVTGEIYHVFNRSVAKQPIFMNNQDYKRFLDVINFYRFKALPLRFSHYNRLSKELKMEFESTYMINSQPMVKIISFCIMPNHFHFLLKPLEEHAISHFIRNLQHSYSKYFNTKYDRTGSLFQSMFKAVRTESDDQLIHVSRYIHLNPATSYIVQSQALEAYPWSSLSDYLASKVNLFVDPELVLCHFKSVEKYRSFIFDQIDYQRELAKIRHLTIE